MLGGRGWEECAGGLEGVTCLALPQYTRRRQAEELIRSAVGVAPYWQAGE